MTAKLRPVDRVVLRELGDVARVVTDSDPVTLDALAEIPDVATAITAAASFEDLNTELKARPRPDDLHRVAASQILAELATGKPPSLEDLLTKVDAVAHVRARESVFDDILGNVQARLAGDIHQALHTGSHLAYAHLDKAVKVIVDEAKAMHAHDLTDAAQALRLGKGEDWIRLEDLATQYGKIRRTQRLFDLSLLGHHELTGNYEIARLAQGVNDAWPGFTDWARAGFVTTSPATTPPWPGRNLGDHDDQDQNFAMVRWLAGPWPVHAWVPNNTQLYAERQSLAAATRKAADEYHERVREGRSTVAENMLGR